MLSKWVSIAIFRFPQIKVLLLLMPQLLLPTLMKLLKLVRTALALFWVIMQGVVIISYSTFRDSLSVLSSRINNYHFLLRNDPEERSSHLLRGESLNSRTLQLVLLLCRMLTVASSKISDSSSISSLRMTICVPADSSTVSYQQFQQERGLYFKSSVGSQNQILKQRKGAPKEK